MVAAYKAKRRRFWVTKMTPACAAGNTINTNRIAKKAPAGALWGAVIARWGIAKNAPAYTIGSTINTSGRVTKIAPAYTIGSAAGANKTCLNGFSNNGIRRPKYRCCECSGLTVSTIGSDCHRVGKTSRRRRPDNGKPWCYLPRSHYIWAVDGISFSVANNGRAADIQQLHANTVQIGIYFVKRKSTKPEICDVRSLAHN